MKYKSLIGLEICVDGFSYLYTTWLPGTKLNTGRGGSNTMAKIVRHEICKEDCTLNGIECVYELFGKDYFIYPITSLEKKGQIPAGYELSINNYEIY